MKKNRNKLSRRDFMFKASTILAGAGLGSFARLELSSQLANVFFPQAQAQARSTKRVIEICFRSGVPFIALGTGREFTQLNAARFVNAPTNPSQFINASGSSLYLNSYATALAPYVDNVAITQGVANQGGHTNLFATRNGGGMGLTSPVVATSNANSSGSTTKGLFWGSRNMVRNELNGLTDLIQVNKNTLFDLFKKPYFPVTENDVKAIIEASESLSRQQAIIIERAMKASRNVASSQGKAVSLLNQDMTQLLNTSTMSAGLTGQIGSDGKYTTNLGEPLAYSLKAMANNLTNSAQIAVTTGDWHGFQSMGNSNVTNFGANLAVRMAEAIKFMRATPDPASTTGETLWDTTLIAMTTEFTRGISGIGRDNPDQATSGVVLIGKNVKGGYYGGFSLVDQNGTTGSQNQAFGFDKDTGQPTPRAQNTNAQVYHTIQSLLDNESDSSQVLKAVIRG